MRGNIVAPVQLLLALGLKDAGKTQLAAEIAARYCDFAGERGLALMLSPFGYDMATGMSVKKENWYKLEDFKEKKDLFKSEKKEAESVEPWTSWAAACYLTIAHAVLGE